MKVRILLGVDCDRPRLSFREGDNYAEELRLVKDLLGNLVARWRANSIGWTMFMCGEFIESIADGEDLSSVRDRLGVSTSLCEIACHSYAHVSIGPVAGRPELARLSPAEIANDLDKNHDLLSWLVGDKPSGFGFRSPYGHDIIDLDPMAVSVLAQRRRYSSSWLRTRGCGVCPPLDLARQPFEHLPGFWELPSHGWHDTVFARMSPTSNGPGEGVSAHDYYAYLLRRALDLTELADGRTVYVGLVLHPIAMAKYDPELCLLDALREVVSDASSYISYGQAAEELSSHK